MRRTERRIVKNFLVVVMVVTTYPISGEKTAYNRREVVDGQEDEELAQAARQGELENILREMGLIKDQTKADALSKLQQGIEGINEDTAGAIEAYMNIVSQRVFEQNEYLMQIRDIIVNFNLDVQVATIGQILYQMQQSYLVQQAIQARLDGWSNSNGMAVRVEMI